MSNDNINTRQGSYFLFCKKFFEMRTIAHHLLLLDELMQLIANPKYLRETSVAENVPLLYQLYIELLEVSYKFRNYFDQEQPPARFDMTAIFSGNNEECYTYPFRYLNNEELANPLLALDFLGEETFYEYKSVLYEWLYGFPSRENIKASKNIFFPLYYQLRKLMELAWLIYNHILEHTTSSQSAPAPGKFEDTCPLLLPSEDQSDPYLEIESFFNGASLGYYKYELRSWFKIAITEDMEVKKHGNLIYFHNQLIQLLHAGYLIVTRQIIYVSKTTYAPIANTFKDWVNEIKKEKIDEGIGIPGSYEICLLSEAEIQNPMAYLKQILSVKRIAEIRYGLQEWIYCSFNGNNSIATMEPKYVVDLYQQLEKILEILFVLVAG